MDRRFAGKVALITGASTGIGAAAARSFASEGASVVLAARGEEALLRVATEIKDQGGSALVLPTDVTDAAAATALVDRAASELGGIDILVNNAGYNRRGPIERYTAEELCQVVQVNLAAPIALTRLVLPHMRRRGGGAVVNVASLAGKVPVKHSAVYSATKFGLRAFTYALAEELEGSGILVSVVSPGPVDTGFIMEEIDDVSDLVFAQPMSTAEDIARLILDCAKDGKVERERPRLSGYLATVGYVFPSLRRLLVPLMERRGRRAKERYRARR